MANDIFRELQARLDSITCYGKSRHRDKHEVIAGDKSKNLAQRYIYSKITYFRYRADCRRWLEWEQKNHPETKHLSQAKKHANEFLEQMKKDNVKSTTLHNYACAINKVFGKEIITIDLGKRERAKITNNRKELKDLPCKRYFNESNHKTAVEFCKNSGVRRSEFFALTQKDIFEKNGQWYVYIKSGKGGKSRTAEIIEMPEALKERLKTLQPNEKVFSKEGLSKMPVHRYRTEYATKMVEKYSRPLDEISQHEKYYFRGDMKGLTLDKQAMEHASKQLGHNRIDVIASSYSYKMK